MSACGRRARATGDTEDRDSPGATGDAGEAAALHRPSEALMLGPKLEESLAMVEIDALERLLLAAGSRGETLTYGAILRRFGRRVTPVTVAALCRDLGRVCRRVEARGGPDLACLVVRRSDGLPGEGHFAALREEGVYRGPGEGPLARRFLADRQRAAFAWCRREAGAADWSPPELDFLV